MAARCPSFRHTALHNGIQHFMCCGWMRELKSFLSLAMAVPTYLLAPLAATASSHPLPFALARPALSSRPPSCQSVSNESLPLAGWCLSSSTSIGVPFFPGWSSKSVAVLFSSLFSGRDVEPQDRADTEKARIGTPEGERSKRVSQKSCGERRKSDTQCTTC